MTFNYLQNSVPKYDGIKGLARNAGIGMCASFVSDCISNSLRVIKTIKQTSGNVDKVSQVNTPSHPLNLRVFSSTQCRCEFTP